MIEVVKRADDKSADVIRLYEAFNRRTEAVLHFGRRAVAVYECNMLEQLQQRVLCDGTTAVFEIHPYEIKTFKVIWEK